MSDEISFSEFARLQGWSPSYVTKLKEAGRLVLTADGQRVRVAESLTRIKDTEDPNRDDVRARHARARTAAGGAPLGETGLPPTADPQNPAGQSFANARAVKERFLALLAKLEYERATGKVVETADVHAAGTEAGTVLRAGIESLPDLVAPLLAEGDPVLEERIHARLSEHINLALTEISDKLKSLSEQLAVPRT